MLSAEDDPLTTSVISSFGPNSSPRSREILTGLVQCLHAFCREVNLTTEELYIAIEALNRSGQMSNAERNETLLISDCLGVEAYALVFYPLLLSLIFIPDWSMLKHRKCSSKIMEPNLAFSAHFTSLILLDMKMEIPLSRSISEEK